MSLTGCRYKRVIKQSLNKYFGNTSQVNVHLAGIISTYSHGTLVQKGSCFTMENMFFVVDKVISPHWLVGDLVPGRTSLINQYGVYLLPDYRFKPIRLRKKIFDPFEAPTIKFRSKKYRLQVKYESLPYHNGIFRPLARWY